MKIKREVAPGVTMEIELTKDELTLAWEEKQFNAEAEDLHDYLETCSEAYAEDVFGVPKDVLLSKAQVAASYYESILDASELAAEIRDNARHDAWQKVADDVIRCKQAEEVFR